MIQQRPELEKGSKKYICPNCGKKTFVYYRMNGNGNIIDESVGKCDRIDKCAYHKKPGEWFKEHPDYNIEWDSYQKSQTIKKIENKRPIEISYIPLKYIFEKAKTRNSDFVYFLFNLFDWETIKRTVDPYFLGCTENKAVIFPQIDENGKCRTAKVQTYNKETGKRQSVYLYHKDNTIKDKLPNPYNLKMCLFGLHLIRSAKNIGKTIAICESEKSAIIAAGCMPEYLWMAAGALQWLNVDKLKPLKGRNIILFPDTSFSGIAFNKWNDIANEANRIGLSVTVSRMLEEKCTKEQKEKGYDLGDFLIDGLLKQRERDIIAMNNPIILPKQVKESTVLSDMMKLNPALGLLIDSLDLVEV